MVTEETKADGRKRSNPKVHVADVEKSGELTLAGRTVQVVTDLSEAEQLYLYERSRRFKAKSRRSVGSSSDQEDTAPPLIDIEDADVPEKVDDPNATVYLLFMQSSTRTRESLRNAAIYHGVKMNEFQAETSSFQKNETITDTMKMLTMYSTQRTVFVVRSPMEGLCNWLQTVMPQHTERFGIPKPAFLNAGDGQYTTPILEMVDTFTLLERNRWDRSFVHLALVGDLAHGRTAHSKADNLKIFGRVKVDLVSPKALEYPVEYRNRMRDNGFEVREFDSLAQYIEEAGDSLAATWYFFRPKFDRYGEVTEELKKSWQDSIKFRIEWEPCLPADACFLQTLPRDMHTPIIPLALDKTPLNGWDRLANNAHFLHVVLLSMLFGKIGRGIPKQQLRLTRSQLSMAAEEESDTRTRLTCPFAASFDSGTVPEFIEVVECKPNQRLRRPERVDVGGLIPIMNGLVIDHIGMNADPEVCWDRLRTVRMTLGWSKYLGCEGVYPSMSTHESMFKGIMSFPDFDFSVASVPQMKMLASIAPGCTMNAITNSEVVGKYRLHVPRRIYNLPNICCKNELCVSSPSMKQRDVVAFFERVRFYETSILPGCKTGDFLYVCKYCKWPHQYADIWTHTKTKPL